ncbi:hypothetical protein NHX12_009969 [Muraenolepis orangiensis]|uniref:Ig-like domain-containing protein n=1 Tax=Muraenolepis orangiensis TaxID=630683 RepID=A0A9Q0IA01_9TELE|nr:hypothetical protein NHX12_009969 [Muraenolepis orangiensis]
MLVSVFLLLSVIATGVDLTCSHSADFGEGARVEWKFNDLKGSTTYVVFDDKATDPYANRVTVFPGTLRFNKVTRKDNGEYDCEVSSKSKFGEAKIKLTVLVPAAIPKCGIPTSVTTKGKALLTCSDKVGSPPPTYKWYRDNTLLPENPKQFPAFQNSTYRINFMNGNLVSPPPPLPSCFMG